MKKQEISLSDHFTYPVLIRFTLPSMLMMVVASVYSIVDGFFVSNFVGSDAFAAVNLVMPLCMLVTCPVFLLSTGGSALISKTLGEKKEPLAREYFSLLVYLTTGIGLVLAVPVLLLTPQLVTLLGAEGEIYTQAITYARILIVALPAYMLQILFQSFLVVAEKPNLGMVVSVISGVTNVVFDALFIIVFQWGIAGAAIATVMGQVFGGLYPVVYFLRRKNRLLWFTKTRFYGKALRWASVNGIANFVENVSASLLGVVYNWQLMQLLGSDGVVVYGVLMYINYIVTGVYLGYSIGIAPVFSFHYGAGNTEENRGLFKRSLIFLGAASLLLTALVLLLARPLAACFVSYDEGLMTLSVAALREYGVGFLLMGFNMFAAAFFSALGNGGTSALLSTVRTLVFQIGCVFAVPALLGRDLIWLAIPVAEALTLVLTVICFARNRGKYAY